MPYANWSHRAITQRGITMSSIALNKNDVELVTVNNGQPMTTSLAVAEKFGKSHSFVLRALRNIDCSEEFNQCCYASVEYTDKKGESRPMVTMTKNGFVFLVMGFTGKKAAKFKEDYINEFDRMTEHLNTARFAHIELQIWENKEVGDDASGSYHGKGLRHRRDTKQENHENIARLRNVIQPVLTNFDESISQIESKDGE